MGQFVGERDKLLLALMVKCECVGLKTSFCNDGIVREITLGKGYLFEKGKSTKKSEGFTCPFMSSTAGS
jgi:hypothetical protein